MKRLSAQGKIDAFNVGCLASGNAEKFSGRAIIRQWEREAGVHRHKRKVTKADLANIGIGIR